VPGVVLALPSAPRLDRVSTAELVAGTLRGWITRGQLPPGARLSEAELCEALGVSRNTLREAFRLLEHEHLIVHRLNRGVFIRTLTAADVTDLYLVREMIEVAGVRAAGAADDLRRARVSEAVASGSRAAAAGDWAAVATADLAFHRALAALTGSPRIDEIMERVLAELRLAFAAVGEPEAFHRPYLHRNAEFADLLRAGQLGRLESELRAYLAEARDQILSALRDAGGKDAE
jgi:DNA-binding GntR family transcriptional regulator